ncbi:hypothetical protein R0K20_21375, partial [Staphylococcus sp. SIMBA_130]
PVLDLSGKRLKISLFLTHLTGKQIIMVKPSLSSERKQQLFRQILDGYKTQAVITRKGLAITNKLRPATVTQLIGEMIQSGIIAED